MKLGSELDGLLRSPEPSIRWRARVRVLGEDRESRRVAALEEEIRQSPRVKSLLRARDRLGLPDTSSAVYHKWQGIHWVLLSLADLGYPRGDSELFPLRDRMLSLWLGPPYYTEFDVRSKAASYGREGVPRMEGRYRRCASQQGAALYSTTVLGLEDERSEKLVERLLHWQWPDGGWNCDRHPSADTSSFCETMIPMSALAVYGVQHRSSTARATALRASEVFLRRRLYRKVSTGGVIRSDFLRLHYPLYWHYDFLGALRAMVLLGKVRDPRCEEALDHLESRRLADGGWRADAKFYSRVSSRFKFGADYVDWGGASARPNPWITTDVLAVLHAAGRWTP